MKIGYPCINLSLECRSSRTFRLKNYSHERLIETVEGNLNCLEKILEYNKEHEILFFRITSDLIPFGSHPVMDYDWQDHFKSRFRSIGKFIKDSKMRITMHPGQYTVLNSKSKKVYRNAIKDLDYHVQVLDLMKLESTAKVQIHVGGVYGDKKKSLSRFIERYHDLEGKIKERFIIENDDKSYTLKDCLEIHESTHIPIVFDILHHECKNQGESLEEAFNLFNETWSAKDGLPIVHYSTKHPDKGGCSHANEINLNHFNNFLNQTKDYNFDVMLEIKNKENSVLEALKYLLKDSRFNRD